MQDALSIARIKARAVVAPLARPIRTASGTIPSAPLVLIDLVTDRDIVGRAYLFGYTPVTLKPLVALLGNLEEPLLGKAVAPVDRMRDLTDRFRLLGRQGLLGMAMSGLEMAMWDALGRVQGLPLCRLLGGRERPVPAYDSYGVLDPVEDRAVVEASLRRGFRAIKTKLGHGDIGTDVRTVAGLRELVGDEVALLVDYNQSLSVPEAIRRINRLSEFGLLWVEEPVPAEDLAGHAAVRAACDTAIQTGENWWFPEDAARALAAGASDLAMLDVMKIGGVTGWLRAAAQAEGGSLPVSSHLFAEISAHLLAVTPNAHYLEYLDIAGSVLRDPPEIADGALVPSGPGAGLEWDEKAVAKYGV